MLAAGAAEGLARLGRIDGRQPHGDLLISARIAAPGLERVAVGDADDKAK